MFIHRAANETIGSITAITNTRTSVCGGIGDGGVGRRRATRSGGAADLRKTIPRRSGGF